MEFLDMDSNVLAAHSVSRQLSLDLAIDTPNHFTATALGIKTGAQAQPTEVQSRVNAVFKKLVRPLLDADVIVVCAPLHHFSIPTQLKA